MEGYTSSSYGDAFADVYDEWYSDVSDVDATVDLINALAAEVGHGALPVLELGVGTGRLAVPLAARRDGVHGIDTSAAMLAKLRQRDSEGVIDAHQGDMVDDLPPGPFAVVFAAFNTFFNLLDESRQRACFAAVRQRLAPAGCFVIEAFVPDPRSGSSVELRSMTVDHVVLSVARYEEGTQTAHGQYISIHETGGVRLRPWAIRYATVEQLDAMAEAAGLALTDRWEDPRRSPFVAESPRHVSVYRTNHTPVPSAAGPTS